MLALPSHDVTPQRALNVSRQALGLVHRAVTSLKHAAADRCESCSVSQMTFASASAFLAPVGFWINLWDLG